MTAGIDDISIYIPRLYLDAGDFAKARGLDPEKLERGLGIGQMAIVDTNQDPACLASNACLNVMQKNKMKLADCMLQQNHHLMNQRP
jgi:hydroxymethylglutaryl-CoA synthase